MNPDRIEVRLELRYVEQYKVRKEYECLDDVNKEEIIGHLAGLVVSGEKDEAAINFDVAMYGLMLSAMIGEDYQMNYQDTPFGLLIRKIAKMDRNAAYAAFSTFIAEERPNAEQIHFIEQVVDYVAENGYINNILDLMKAPFDRPYKFSVIFTREEQMKLVQVIKSIKNNALVA